MSDLIDRQKAVDAVLGLSEKMKNEMLFIDAIVDEIENLPSAEPERKPGKWKPDESGNVYWICSVCGFASEAFGADILYHFCPNCGADMRGDK